MSKVALQIGNDVFVRTVTYHYTGKVVEITGDYLVLEDAAWIPQSARWSETLKTGELREVEPYVDPVTLNAKAIVDATLWRFALPRKAK